MCRSCLSSNLPFSNVEEISEFSQIVGININSLNDRLLELNKHIFNLNPFSNLGDKLVNNNDIDVDENYFDCFVGQCLGYMDTDQLNVKMLNEMYRSKLQSIVHINARSLISNIDLFCSNLKSLKQKFSIICASETWTDVHTEQLISIPGYECIL